MYWLGITIWTYLVFVLQSAFASHLAIAGYAPQLVIAGLVLIVAHIAGRQGIFLAAIWGLISDCQTDGRIGLHLCCFVSLMFVTQQMHAWWKSSSPVKPGALAATFVFAHGIASVCFVRLLDGQPPEVSVVCVQAAGSALFTGLFVSGAVLAARFVVPRTPADVVGAAPTVSNKWHMLTE